MRVNLIAGTAMINDVPHSAPYSFDTTGFDGIETDEETATLQFDTDKSILRLDKNTLVMLEP
jgi:hypothetical protein